MKQRARIWTSRHSKTPKWSLSDRVCIQLTDAGGWGYVGIHTKRQATQHGCLPSLHDGDWGIEIVYGEGKQIFCTGNKSLFYQHVKPNEPTKEGPLSFVLFESPLTSQFQLSAGVTPLSGWDERVTVYVWQCNRFTLCTRKFNRSPFHIEALRPTVRTVSSAPLWLSLI